MKYREIKEPERPVFTFARDRADGTRSPETEITVLFAEAQGKTAASSITRRKRTALTNYLYPRYR